MAFSLYRLVVTGPDRVPALLTFEGKSHLIFGPTDTGKSYIVECLRYCLGGGDSPKDVGYSNGYTRAALQITLSSNEEFTIFRDLATGNTRVFSGHYIYPPQDGIDDLGCGVSELLPKWSNAADKKILIKSGELGNLTAGDLRRVSIFDEIETLNNVSFEGSDSNLKTRNKSSIAYFLSGIDDSDLILARSTKDLNVAKGHVEAIQEQIAILMADIPEGITKKDAEEGLTKITTEIENVSAFMQTNSRELELLKQEQAISQRAIDELKQQILALNEAKGRFLLLDKKYESDLHRLKAISTAASILPGFKTRDCPLCLADITHQPLHDLNESRLPVLQSVAEAESVKIVMLRRGLSDALTDLLLELESKKELLDIENKRSNANFHKQELLLSTQYPTSEGGISRFVERKSELTVILSDLNRIEILSARLDKMKIRSKRQKQVVQRDLSNSANDLCTKVKYLLDDWGVPDVNAIHFDEAHADLMINQRKRVSFGKGKRGIFLTAFMVALMERAIRAGLPHIGVLVVDSPVVTYKDPKHAPKADNEIDDLLDVGVKDKFYSWLATRDEIGQVIVLENEEPDSEVKSKLNNTEFVGREGKIGRKGFFPI